MNTLIIVLYCVPVIIGLLIQGFWAKESEKGEDKFNLAYFLSIWVPGFNILVVLASLFMLALYSFFKRSK